jgi:hypothetical protein
VLTLSHGEVSPLARPVGRTRSVAIATSRDPSFDGVYHRFAGKVTIDRLEGDAVAERIDGQAI